MASEDGIQIWTPSRELAREKATVPAVSAMEDFDGFIPAHAVTYEEDNLETGERRYALNSRREFQRILDGYACPKCLAKFRRFRTTCCLCDWERDLSKDIIEQVPDYWKSGPSRTSSEILGEG